MAYFAKVRSVIAFLRSETPVEDISANPLVRHPHNTSRSIPARLPAATVKQLSALEPARALAATALAGSNADSCLTVAAGNRSGIDLLVLCGCLTSGFAEMSSTGVSDRRKAMTLLTLAKYAINLLRATTSQG